MLADIILSRIANIRQTAPDRWIARCPAHEDRSPSLAIREVDDRLLLHCFAGCSVYEVVSAVGLSLSDLFPEKITLEGNRPERRPFPAADVLRALASDCIFMMLCAGDLAKGKQLEQSDKDHLVLIAGRFHEALRAGGISVCR
jgi:hypothetical protein